MSKGKIIEQHTTFKLEAYRDSAEKIIQSCLTDGHDTTCNGVHCAWCFLCSDDMTECYGSKDKMVMKFIAGKFLHDNPSPEKEIKND